MSGGSYNYIFYASIIGLMGLLLILLVLLSEMIKVSIIEPKINEYVNSTVYEQRNRMYK